MLQWLDICHAYDARKVLDDVSLTLDPGRVLGLLGPSGCGKTTLLHMAAGLLRPSLGSVRNSFARSAVVFQEPRLLPWFDAGENMALGLRPQGVVRAERRRIVERLGSRLGLTNQDLARLPAELSGGMRQRVALGRALAVDPDVLLLDEPFSALDYGLRRNLQTLMLELAREKAIAVLFITHDLTEALRISDEVVVMAGWPGRIVHHLALNLPKNERDDPWVFERAAHLMRTPAVAGAFGENDAAAVSGAARGRESVAQRR